MNREAVSVLVIAGPSGGGKTAAATELLRRRDEFSFIRSATTRAPRGDGHDGEYIYLTEDEFRIAAQRGEMVEHMEYAGSLYGTPRSELERVRDEGRIPLLILDLKGVKSVAAHPDVNPCSVYIYSPAGELDARLKARYLIGDNGANTSAYEARREQNRRDYQSMPEVSDKFYAVLKNDSTVSSLADRLASVFSDFLAGKAPDRVKISTAAEEIACEATDFN